MRRGDRPASRQASGGAADPLDEALRQIGAELLEEPVPERLRQTLRQAQPESDTNSKAASDNPKAATDEPGEGTQRR
jgi:hypothetical protein